MSFCCGASMIGTIGTLKHFQSYIHQVPLLYCPVCQATEVHPKVKDEYEILADYAHSDQAPEVTFHDYIDKKNTEDIFIDCVDIQEESMAALLRAQIDNALDLLSMAKHLKDTEWQKELYHRLKVFSERLKHHQQKEEQIKDDKMSKGDIK